MFSPFEQALGNAKLSIFILGGVLAVSLILNIFLGYSLSQAPKQVRVYASGLPTDKAIIVAPDTVQKETVYSMAEFVWTQLNSWENNGYADSVSSIKDTKAYMTPHFQKQYAKILDELNRMGYVQDYIQSTVPTHGFTFSPDNVIKKGNAWFVRVHFTSRFYYNVPNTSKQPNMTAEERFKLATQYADVKPVKVITAEFVFKVVPYPVSKQNEYGLAIDGLIKAPKILQQKTDLGD